ncbi:trifunctional uridine nucleosidase/nicotinamide riboside hydrolase/nicotinic acid riboside hydrolase NDAI_0A04260 [Naumovozyma dairenensis CBS 421]|uniref:Inosine/uridine-preferring nucleoside hydrolase domain-containing protein n=1 Tax=Naumovozyma dairenensis (strain ATCC 10597 / BCRC 20456 / CBS 421 / NBRC 0211 / NRRL Y-12639) TaxID=1071378 RepID=G0W445_NAUDC|nr:hypothetical protein NDAI_0A04260 [Naumovozyma dairenensis CBS 421]CCD22583.1 hypothetical protein NDAI_0A04260 [Naumovozyma dairenensis CBS 421]
MTVSPIPIWLDCDPGHDDAIAILLACFHPAFKLIGISACYGNSTPEHTDYNARSLLTAMGKAHSVPVFKGAQVPWFRKPEYAPDIHGATGLDGTSLLPTPECSSRDDMTYLEAMEKAILKYPGQISLVSTGALTSVATLLKEKPHLKKCIRHISIMGGGFGLGNKNINLSAEFNIWVDPHAANFIFHDTEVKTKCILIPLNLTHMAIATKDIEVKILGDGNSKLRKLFFELFQFFGHTYKDIQGFDDGPPVHDPLTLLPLLECYGWYPSSTIQFEYRRMDVNVIDDLKAPDVGRIFSVKEYPRNSNEGIIVGRHLNISFFWDQVLDALDHAQKHSTIETDTAHTQ